MPNASASDYATARACPPSGFEYTPDLIETPVGYRAVDPYGDVCSLVPDKPLGVDFSRPCLTHDYGYDLVRSGDLSDKGPVDEFFHVDIVQTSCLPYFGSRDFQACGIAADTYYIGVVVLGKPSVGEHIDTD